MMEDRRFEDGDLKNWLSWESKMANL